MSNTPARDAPHVPEERVYTVFQGSGEASGLGRLCTDLLNEQKAAWPDCRRGYEAVATAEYRTLRCHGFSVMAQHNPGRIVSTDARVEESDTAKRPCFLCTERLPAGQKALLYRDNYVILCNPVPVFPVHFTVAHIRHQPQRVLTNGVAFLQLVLDLGCGWAVLYNGPRCGASAPDHLHFQAVPAGLMPIEAEIDEEGRLVRTAQVGTVSLHCAVGLGREVILLEGTDLGALDRVLVSLLNGFRKESTDPFESGEPMVNLMGLLRDGVTRIIIFPRRAHRPRAYFRSGKERLLVSPAVAEMGGVIVTPVLKDFEHLAPDMVEEIYREVSLDRTTVEKVIDNL